MKRFFLATVPWAFVGAAVGMSLHTHSGWDWLTTTGLALMALACVLIAVALKGWR